MATARGGGFAVDPKDWLLHSVPEGDAASEEYVDMYWLDATEANGVVYVFGKIPVKVFICIYYKLS